MMIVIIVALLVILVTLFIRKKFLSVTKRCDTEVTKIYKEAGEEKIYYVYDERDLEYEKTDTEVTKIYKETGEEKNYVYDDRHRDLEYEKADKRLSRAHAQETEWNALEIISVKLRFPKMYEEFFKKLYTQQITTTSYHHFYFEFKHILDKIEEPEWCYVPTKLHIKTELQGFQGHAKGDIAPQLIRESYEILKLSYNNSHFHVLSCDASIRTNTGLAVYDETKSVCSFFKIEDELQSTAAELIALSEAVTISINQKYEKVVIFTDSKSACQLLQNPSDENILVTKIHEKIDACYQLEEVHIIWAPGHTGILVNELADKGAEMARSGGGKPIIQPLTPKEGGEKINKLIWQSQCPTYTLTKHPRSDDLCLPKLELELIKEEIITLKIQFPQMYEEFFLNSEATYICVFFKFYSIINRIAPDNSEISTKISVKAFPKITPTMIKSYYSNVISDYKDSGFHVISSNASVNTNTGYVVYDGSQNSCDMFKIEDELWLTTANLIALSEAITICERRNYERAAIFIDNRATYELLQNLSGKNCLISEIHRKVRTSDKLKNVHIIWIPRSKEILINEIASRFANIARTRGKPTNRQRRPRPLTLFEGHNEIKKSIEYDRDLYYQHILNSRTAW